MEKWSCCLGGYANSLTSVICWIIAFCNNFGSSTAIKTGSETAKTNFAPLCGKKENSLSDPEVRWRKKAPILPIKEDEGRDEKKNDIFETSLT